MKKKVSLIVSCLLLLAMMAGLVSCAGSGTPASTAPASTPPASAAAPASTSPAGEPADSADSAAPADSGAPPAAPATDLELPSMITLATHATGSLYHNIGSGLATIATQNTSMEVKVSALTGPTEWMPMFTTGEVELGVLNCWDAQQAWLGGYDYEAISGGEGFPVRLVTNGSYNIASVLTATDANINTAQDLYDKNFVLGVTGSAGITMQNEAFIANHQLDRSRLNMITVTSIIDGVEAIIDGRADSTSVSLGVAKIEELNSTRGAKYLNWDPSPEAVARANEYFPLWVELVEPGPGTAGISEPTYMYFFSNYLVARTDVADDVIYAVTQSLWNHYEELGVIHPSLDTWVADRFIDENALVPYHEGAVRFYKEQGVWTDTMEAKQQELLALEAQ